MTPSLPPYTPAPDREQPVSPAPAPPARTLGERLAGSWWRVVRWLLVAIPVVGLGLGTGVALAVLTRPQVHTADDVSRPPAEITSFSWPLRLTRRVNVLLIGVDVTLNTRRQVVPISRADSLMLVTFDPDRNRISGLSIPRDTQAAIPGVGPARINASYAFGGPSLTVRTVEQLLGVPVHYYVKLGPASFARLIDAVGGVEIDVEKDMKYRDWWGGLNINLKKGRQVLNGEQAMGYARFRHDALGDLARVQRQQKVLLALFHKLKAPGTVLAAPRLLRAFTENTQTNLTPAELITLGAFAARLSGSDLQFATLPGRVGPTYIFPDPAQVRAVVLELVYGVRAAELASTPIEVLNASGVPGLARQTALRLQQLGFVIVRVDTAPAPADATTIIDRAGKPQVARLLAEILGRSRITRQHGAGPDITVLVARDVAAGRLPLASR